MRAVATEVEASSAGIGLRRKDRAAQLRKSRMRRIILEGLETRTLMATIPGALVTGQLDVSNAGGNQSSPSIAVDPINPQSLVAVWTRLDPALAPGPTTVVGGAYSSNGGTSWSTFTPANILTDPTSAPTAPTAFAQTTDATVDFDRNGNFFVLVSEHKADNSVGALVLNKYHLAGGAPSIVIANDTVYSWSVDQVVKPTLAVDNNVASFTDGSATQTDNSAGAVYIAWGSVDINPNNFGNWNPNAIRMIGSGDGGQTFSGITTVNTGGNFGAQRDTAPRLVISQGTASGTVIGGRVTAVWDDFGTLATAIPTPLDRLMTAPITGLATLTAGATPGGIADAGLNNVPTTTLFPISVPPSGLTVSDLTVTLDIAHPALGDLSINLVAPDGTIVQLFATAGVSGANFGFGTGGSLLGTTFDNNSPRALANGAAPYIGSFRPSGNLATFFNKPIQSGVWTLQITDSTTGNFGQLLKGFLTFSQGLAAGGNVQAATPTVRGSAGSTYGTASAADPLGIGPDASLASDNTLGAFSPNQGRLYLTYVDRSTVNGNPADNTDIYLKTSTNGGASWSGAVKVNNDVATTDGFSEGGAGLGSDHGRAQFQPSVAVDQGTGTVVVAYLDGRYDASRARVATTIAASIDGGATFGPQNFANTPIIAKDEATGQSVTISPILDNESAGNTATGSDLTTFAFGDHQGLAVAHGHVYPAWSSNLNGGNDGKQLLNIRVATAEIAAGPRILSGTMGPVGQLGDTLNNVPAADGTPIARAFIITFDRPVDPGTFGIGAVQVFYRDTTATNSGGGFVPVTGVSALNANALGATQFQVNFQPRSGVGTYSYAISPVVSDRIRSTVTQVNPTGGTSTRASVDVPKAVPDLTTITSVLPINGFPALQVVSGLTVNFSINHTYDSDLQITLIAPDGTRVLLVDHRGPGGQNFTNTTLDDASANPIALGAAPYTGTFKPDSALALLRGKALNGVWSLEVADTVPVDSGTLLNWSLTLQPGIASTTQNSGNLMDENGDATPGAANDFFAIPTPLGTTPFASPYNQNTLPLIVPGPHVVNTSVPGGVADAPGTTQTLMLNGTVSALIVTFDRDMNPATITPGAVLRIQGPTGLIGGPYTVTPINARTYQIGFPTQQLSGTYTVTLDSSIQSASGFALDTNVNAGIDLLRGTSSNAPVPITFVSANVPVALAPLKTSSSTITLTDDFVNQGLTLSLDITDTFDPDLSAVLIAPDGTTIPLFTAVGTNGNNQNFTSTVFDDSAVTPIQNGIPPFFGRFQPQQPLGVLNGSSSVKGPGGTGVGVYTLQITNNSTTNTGTLNSWSLTLQKPTLGTDLGEPVADRAQLGFRIFTMDPTNLLASSTWTSIGPASIGGSNSGRIGGIAIDPSDPSGNTVYVGGATGGVWKTNNFLTTDARGPTYLPITDFGPTFGINIGGVAVFGRNHDPNQSIIVVATGDGDGGAGGVGFLISKDAGATWALSDSTDNTLPLASRDHKFAGTTAFKVVVDPHPTTTGDVIIYAALSGPNGGLWRSTDSGLHWTNNRAGQATDVVLDPNSGPIDAISNPTGNLQVVYAAFRGDGVYISPNEGQVWNQMTGGVGDPLIQDPTFNPAKPIPVGNLGVNPNGPNGRIVLAKPALFPSSDPNATLKNFIYQGWLYAAVVTPDNHLQGLYLTKDNGQNWTNVSLPTLPPAAGDINAQPRAIPSNDTTLNNYDVLGNATFAQGNYDVSLAVDPTNPNIAYLGGTADGQPTGLLRIDTSYITDPHSFYLADTLNDGGTLTVNSTAGVALKQTPTLNAPFGTDPRTTPYVNLIRPPGNPLAGSATFYVNNTLSFANTGASVKWIPFDQGAGGTDQHRVVTMVDPLTGHARLIFGDDQGIFSSVDNGDGTISAGIGTASQPSNSRNGNLQITQFYYGAAQPSSAASLIAGALFYGQAQDDGFPRSDPNLLSNGNLRWTGPAGDGTGVATDQTGSGTLYQYNWPCCGGNVTDFFQVNGVGRTNGLIQTSGGKNVPDPQWPYVAGFNFAVNPINGSQIAISSGAGRIFRTEDKGLNWLVVGDPAVFSGSNAPAIAFGSPDPALTGGSLDNFIYAGTNAGHIFVTFTGGGASGNNWTDITNGALASDGSGIQSIATDPIRGNHDAYAVTSNGVYYIEDSNPAAGKTWQGITTNLFQITHNSFGDPSLQEKQLHYLTALAADWRYTIPNATGSLSHPVLYVGGEGGVYRSVDQGASWLPFPSNEANSVPLQPVPPGIGGGLPNVHVVDLDLALGNVDPTTGKPVFKAGDPNILMATTYGRGAFAVRLAPVVLPVTPTNPNAIHLDPTSLLKISTSGIQVTSSSTPIIDGLSEQSDAVGVGNKVTIALFDLTLGEASPIPIPLTGSTLTNNVGAYFAHVAPGYFTKAGTYTIGVQASDLSGTKGNLARFTFIYEPTQPPAPLTITLDASTDSGTYNGDDYTRFNNSVTAAPGNAPLFDITGILPQVGVKVALLRALKTTDALGNITIGAYQVVNSVITTNTSGIVQIADTNAGNGTIADSPINPLIDASPPQPNEYLYTTYQVDTLSVQSPNLVPSLPVIIDSTAPKSPTSVKLSASTDSGTSNGDSYTNFNNKSGNAPLFDVTGIEPHATVKLYRDYIDPVTGNPFGTPILVNTIQDVTPTGPKNTVQIADINGNNTPIPDNPIGNPADTAPPKGYPYIYTAVQLDLAGNLSTGSPSFGNRGAIVLDGTDSDLHGGTGAGGVNINGWLYMQKVLEAIQPNVTDGQRILVALGAQDKGYAASSIKSAFTLSPLPGLGWTIEYVNGTANMSTFLSGGSATATDGKGAALGNLTIAQTGLLFLPSANETGDDLTDADLTMLGTHGADFKNYLNAGGGLYTQGETNQDPTVKGYAWLTSSFPGITYTSLGGGGEFATNIVLTPTGLAIFPGLTPADLSTGPVHGYFGGTIPAALATVFTFDETTAGTVPLGLSSVGGGVTVSGNQVIIDSIAPATPVLSLDPASDTGTFNNDKVTKKNNNPSPANAPVFDLTGTIEPNAIVKLRRALINPVSGLVGPAFVVNSFTQGAAPGVNPTIADINLPGGGTIADGKYLYTIEEVDLAGNTKGAGSAITVVIQTVPPAAPTSFKLDPAFDTGTFNNDGITKDNNGLYPAPQFDLSGVVPHGVVNLLRQSVVNGNPVGAAVVVNTLIDTGAVPGTPFLIADTNQPGGGAIPDGTYLYTSQQFDLAGNPSPISASYTVMIDTDGPQANPPATPALEAGSDTGTFLGDQVTQDNNGKPFPAPLFDVGTVANPVEAGATVQLWRAPVDPVSGVVGVAVLVDQKTNTSGGIVPIADINTTDSTIPDGKYLYTSRLIDLAGVVGSFSARGQTVIIKSSTPATPAPFRLDALSDTGVSNSDNITQIVKVAHPVFDAGSASGPNAVLKGATLILYRDAVNPFTHVPVGAPVAVTTLVNLPVGGLVKITDTDSLPDGQYVYTIQQIDLAGNASPIGGSITVTYNTAQPPITGAPVLDPTSDSGTKGDNLTSITNPFFNVQVVVTGFEANSKLTLVRDGVVVNPLAPDLLSYYTVPAGTPVGSAVTVKIQDPGPAPTGTHVYQVFLTDLAGNVGVYSAPVTVRFANDPPGTIILDPASDSGVKGDNVTNVITPTFDVIGVAGNSTLRLLRNGLTVATTATGAGGTVMITDVGSPALTNGVYSYSSQVVAANGTVSPNGPTITVTIDTNAPVAPSALTLDPGSDSGFKGDNVTNVASPFFSTSGVIAGATVKLFRTPVVGGLPTGAPVLVNSVAAAVAGTLLIQDPGPVPDGVYSYTAQQISAAGNASPKSAALQITVNTSVPATPTIVLDPASDSGTKGDNITNVVSPFFDVSGVLAGATLKLYRGGLGVPVKTLSNVAGGTVKIQDLGPLSNGSYTYTVVQTNVAGTDSVAGSLATPLVINTTPPLTPSVPTLSLDLKSDTGLVGDNLTTSRFLIIDGVADPGVAINLYNVSGSSPVLIASGVADGTGKFQLAVPTLLNNGVYKFAATATDTSQHVSALTNPPLQVKVTTVDGDYIGNGKTSLAVFRRTAPLYMQWFVNGNGALANDAFGASILDIPVVGDFNGDGTADPALYRPSTATWFYQDSTNHFIGKVLIPTFGQANLDLPVPADYNGSGVTIAGLYRPTTGQFIVAGVAGAVAVTTPKAGDVPVPADYDHTGKAEFAIYRPGFNASWIIRGPSGVHAIPFGGPGDIPVPGSYDTLPTFTKAGFPIASTYAGAEPAVWRASSGQYFVLGPQGGRAYQFAPGDIPAPGDYDGLGVTEAAVYRPSTAQFLVYGPTDDPSKAPRVLGTLGEPTQVYVPIVAPYSYRVLSRLSIAGAPASQLNFGAAAATMTAPLGGDAFRASVSAPQTTLTNASPSIFRTRPNQAANTARAVAHPPLQIIDHALSTVSIRRKGQLLGDLGIH